ncbi:hypothetical protein ACFQFC_36200 [Amorphoplanes digitatis]|uniref:Peptidase M10 metallopeptidase domain-containing protein n=1 Tax=Actinoplanes digitatis TaxID=1868 RepID=A0A7W7MNZ9_9ACTN|nr:hypothetical protein [Actinoplanes digitatis]MBB4761603.1 hypothetical protein [Actinoplanes digitatis]
MRLSRITTLGGLFLTTALTITLAAPAAAQAATTPLGDANVGVYTGQADQKKPTIPADVKPAIAVSADQIAIQEPRKGGGLVIRLYHLAPGASPNAVLTGLRARGLAPAGVTAQAEADPMECTTSYGSAKYLCLKTGSHLWFNWRWNGFDDPQVYFRDFTPAAWPVRASVTEWNRSPGVDSYWTTGACPGGGRHCVPVRTVSGGPNGIVGETHMEVDSVAFFIDGTVSVDFNTYYSSSDDNRGTACHELGHALGLAHNGSTGSCLYNSAIAGPDPRLPHSTDISVLRYILYAD